MLSALAYCVISAKPELAATAAAKAVANGNPCFNAWSHGQLAAATHLERPLIQTFQSTWHFTVKLRQSTQ